MYNYPTDDLLVIRQQQRRYLFNRSDATLERVRLADELASTELRAAYSSPVYEIRDIPPHSYVTLGEASKYLDGAQLWHIRAAEWSDGTALEEPFRMAEQKKWGGAVFSETHVEREVHHIGTVPAHSLDEGEPEEAKDTGKLYAQKVTIYRDTGRTLHLVNRVPVAAERLQLTRYRYLRQEGVWPESPTDTKTLEVRDLPAKSYVPVAAGFDSNTEKFKFVLTEVDWGDGETYRDARMLKVGNPARSTPLSEQDFTRVDREVRFVGEAG